jgi:hypothetical protein
VSSVRCPQCGNKLVQQQASGAGTRLRIEGPIEFGADGAIAKCYWCKSDVIVPVALNDAPPRLVKKR